MVNFRHKANGLVSCAICGRYKVDDLDFPFHIHYDENHKRIFICENCESKYENKEGQIKKWDLKEKKLG